MSSQLNEEINNKIYQRFVPSHSLPPNLSVYPVPTKYVKLGITDNHPHQNTIQNNYQNFQCNTMFCPTLKNGNYNGYSNNIHLESELRNQFVALQKCDAAEYIPNYKSSLFMYSTPSNKQYTQPFEYLFNTAIYMPFQPILTEQQNDALFFNHTRQQLKDS
jgi:hypothetical protein